MAATTRNWALLPLLPFLMHYMPPMGCLAPKETRVIQGRPDQQAWLALPVLQVQRVLPDLQGQ
ncbi:hypothetical protein [Chitinophaga varians]|uniref:hypothetical protein n=1 Tax=Chitinophaga varians TaxID=2202339 RepID=UPI001FFCCA6B|nr:hypothetical protein [Chitinophaga varians]